MDKKIGIQHNSRLFIQGCILAVLGVTGPALIGEQRLGIYDSLTAAMMEDSGSFLIIAALKLVTMNVVRMIPHYLGAFLINESMHVYPVSYTHLPTVYNQDKGGKRTNLKVFDNDYFDFYDDIEGRSLSFKILYDDSKKETSFYTGLEINPKVFTNPRYASLKAYVGKFNSASEAAAGKEITDELFNEDMAGADAGYLIEPYDETWITIVSFDADGKVTGCLPFEIILLTADSDDNVRISSTLRIKSGEAWESASYSTSGKFSEIGRGSCRERV